MLFAGKHSSVLSTTERVRKISRLFSAAWHCCSLTSLTSRTVWTMTKQNVMIMQAAEYSEARLFSFLMNLKQLASPIIWREAESLWFWNPRAWRDCLYSLVSLECKWQEKSYRDCSFKDLVHSRHTYHFRYHLPVLNSEYLLCLSCPLSQLAITDLREHPQIKNAKRNLPRAINPKSQSPQR